MVMIFTRDDTDYARRVTEFLHDFERRTSRVLTTVNPDSADGAARAQVYDIVEYPTIIATAEDGRLLAQWRGLPLPTIDEVSYYVQ